MLVIEISAQNTGQFAHDKIHENVHFNTNTV